MTATERQVDRYPLEIMTMDFDDPCSDCGTKLTPGHPAVTTPDSRDFYCLACVTRVYEAMKAAQLG